MLKISKCFTRCCFALGVTASVALSGCATTARNSTSVVDYLYPSRQEVVMPSVPTLNLPLRVGIAFAPGNSGTVAEPTANIIWTQKRAGASAATEKLTEMQKLDLMREVGERFRKYPFVRDIELIPTDYLQQRGGFANLDQLRMMFDVDEIVLISYDQTQFVDQGLISLIYWTGLGAYMANGEKNDTQTMLEAVVLDIPSRKMLFRAPGTSLVKGSATLVNKSQGLRENSEEGFRKAAESMIEHLDAQLASFRARVKERPQDFTVIRPEGYKESGG